MSKKNRANKPSVPSTSDSFVDNSTSREDLKHKSGNGNYRSDGEGALQIVQHFSPPSRRGGNGSTDKK